MYLNDNSKSFIQLIVNGRNGKAGPSAPKHVVEEAILQNEQLFRKHPTVENIALKVAQKRKLVMLIHVQVSIKEFITHLLISATKIFKS